MCTKANHTYTRIDPPWIDAWAEVNHSRLIRFWSTTFVDNSVSLDCNLAAVGLALRGNNTDRAFWTVGVGQRLLSHLIAKMLGSHALADMNLQFIEDELRTHGDGLMGKLVTTSQEKLEPDKQM